MHFGQAAKAAAVYFCPVFAVAFALGVVRTMLVAPAVGALAAVAIEVPLILCLSWFVCGWVVRHFLLKSILERAFAGLVAFMLLMAAELALALILGRSATSWLGEIGTAPGLLGLAGQIGFAAMPLIRRS